LVPLLRQRILESFNRLDKMKISLTCLLLTIFVPLTGCGRKAADSSVEVRSAELVLNDRAYEARVAELPQNLDSHVRAALEELDFVLVSSGHGAYRAGDGERVVDIQLEGNAEGETTIRVSAVRSVSMRDAEAVVDLPFAREVLSSIIGSIHSASITVDSGGN
jgi:hypothetical protein